MVAQFLINEPRRDINASMKALDRILNTPRSPAITMQYGAPALLMDNLIDEDLCNRLIEGWKNDHQEGQVNDGKK